jgi:hypothetical protein
MCAHWLHHSPTALPALLKAAERTTSCTSLTSPLVSKSATANTAELPVQMQISDVAVCQTIDGPLSDTTMHVRQLVPEMNYI